jgi:hypothetical protein
MQTASLPALSRMGKLFTRLQEALYNAVMLPTAKQIKVLRTNEKSLKIGQLNVAFVYESFTVSDASELAFQYLSALVLFEALLWDMEVVDGKTFTILEEIVQRLREKRVNENE